MKAESINCSLHGVQGIGLLCTHLAHSLLGQKVVGFYMHDEGDTDRPDAWCNECEARWDLTETESEREQWFLDCDFKLLCTSCWDEAKALNDFSLMIFK